jgi:DnaJ family protein C protein 11
MADSSGMGRNRGSRSQASPASSRAPPVRHGSTQGSNGASRNSGSVFLSDGTSGGADGTPSSSGSNLPSQASSFSLHEQFATSRREFVFEEDEEVLEPAPFIASSYKDAHDQHELDSDEEASADITDETIRRLLHANEESYDYYTLLGLSREPPPTVAEIRAAYHRLSLAFHPDKHPHYLKASAQKYFTRLQKAYETLIEPRKRVIYDLEGEEGVQNEYKTGGAMGQGGEGEKQIGVKAMGADEFRKWFTGVLLERERRNIGDLVGSTSTCKVVLNAQHLFSGSSGVNTFSPGEKDGLELEVPSPLIAAQSLQFRQSFSVPVPGFARLLQSRLPSWKEIIRCELSINNREHGPARSSWEESVGHSIPKLTFSAGISGAMSETLVMRLPDDHHPEEIISPLFRWYTLRSDKINISTRLDHSFTDARDRDGTTSITSLMNGVDLDVTAGILPRRSLNIGLGRLFALVEDTTPFYFHFRTLFNNSLEFKPPVLDFRISRYFGKRHFGYCRWSSGDFGWPALAFMSRISPMTFAKVPLWLPQGLLMSNMRIGYFLVEDGSQMIQTDDEDDMHVLDRNDGNDEKPVSSKATSDNPSWHLAVDSSPYDTRVSVTWGRDVFSRAAGHPIRSRIRRGGEAVARSRDFDVPSSRGVRLEIEGNMGLDLSLGGIVRGVRRIGDFTRIGIGVGLNPERGLFVSFSWSRLGQNIIIPVILLSGDELDSKSIFWALAVPWATYAAVEFGILRPRLRRRRQKLVEKTRKELRENVSRRKVEAEQATLLMRPLVEHRQAIEREQGGLVILRAEYGVRAVEPRSKTNWRPGEVADVTVALSALVDGGQLSLPRGLDKAQIIGFWDPSPLRRKLLVVDYLFGGKRHHVKSTHHDALSLPMRAHEV